MIMKKNRLIRYKKERASAFTSKGSITLEAAIVVPIFFFAMLCLAYLLEMMAIETSVRNGLYSAGKHLAKQGYVQRIITSSEIEQRVIESIGPERVSNSMIAGGADGIDCSDSICNWSTGVMNLCVRYQVEVPVLIFDIKAVSGKETMRVKSWCGYVSGTEDITRQDTVYVTDTGIVYHRDPECTYLDMSIRMVSLSGIEELRNQSGAKYYVCEACKKKASEKENCYITDYGTRYHMSLDCKKIKRNIYAISIEDAHGLGGCSKCVD